VITDGHGTPLAVLLTGGNCNDVTQLLPLLDAVPPVRGRVGHPRRRPDSLFADRGYDHDVYRDQVRARGIVPAIARRSTLHGTGLGTYRGWSSEPSPGYMASAGSASAGKDEPTSTKPSSSSRAA
jgi:transposase